MALPVWCFVTAFVAFVWFSVLRARRRLPPGPTPIPLIGNNLHFLIGKLRGKSNIDVMTAWKDRYGGVYTIWMGPVPVVLVCDYKIAMDSLVKNADAHAGRGTSFLFQKPRKNLGIIFDDGPSWVEHRRFALRTLRNFGLGRNIMQSRILEETFHRFEILDAQIEAGNGRVSMCPAPMLNFLIGSIINKLLAGYRYDEGSEEFTVLKENVDKMFDNITPFDQILFNEYTYKLPFFRNRWALVAGPFYEIMTVMRKQISARRAERDSGRRQLDVNDEGDDLIDAFLIEMKRREAHGEDLRFFTENHLAATLMDLWVAGMETTISALLWTFIYMLNDPSIQVKMREEIAGVTNGNRPVELSDKTNLNYVNAVVTESLRCGNVLNFNLFHKTTCDTQVGDYRVPAGTILTPQVSVIMTEEREFEDPDRFDPERYIANKNLEKQVIPFSVGKRSCLGESLARAEMFLILANFVQKYEISVPEGSDPPSMEQLSLDSLMRRSRRYEMQIQRVNCKDVE